MKTRLSFSITSCFVMTVSLLHFVTSSANFANVRNNIVADESVKPSSNLFAFLIPQTATCLGEEDGPKFLNDTCQENIECFGGGSSMICKHGHCVCKEGHMPEEVEFSGSIKELVCVQAPFLFQPCSSICQKPLTCQNTSIVTPEFKIPPFHSITGKSCQCLPPFKFQDGICYLDCASDEYFIEDRCVKKCKPNEVRLQDYRCVKIASLGSSCESSYQCTSAFSECQSGICNCLSGFKQKNSSCVAEAFNCPIGQPLTEGSTIVPCKTNRLFSLIPSKSDNDKTVQSVDSTKLNNAQNIPFKDSCPSSHFCVAARVDYAFEVSGHCCPKPNVSCPLGSQHSNAVCTFDPEGLAPYCPLDSHYCHSVTVGTHSEQVCCPKACTDGFVLVDGLCYPTVSLGDECKVDQQCKNHDGICISGNCSCPKSMKPTGSQIYQFCQTECATNEILFENQCYSRFPLSGNCNSTNAWRCPLNSVCKKNKCSCLCTMYPINDRLCGPLPFCPASPDSQHGLSEMNQANEKSDVSPKEIFGNATFCKVVDQKALIDNALEKCPEGQYCSNYLPHVGLCCNKPGPICPNGQKPESLQSCDTTSILGCGPNKFCHRYINPADINSQEGFICCPLERPSNFFPVELPPSQFPPSTINQS